MGWLTTTDLTQFRMAAETYLKSRGAEGTLLLTAVRAVRGAQPLFGWWVTPDGTEVRGAFLHDTPDSLLIVGRVPEFAAALAPALHRAGREVCGVDASPEAADAFTAAWTQRTGLAARLHRHLKVYRMAGPARDTEGPAGRARVATPEDTPLLVDWLRAFGTETGDFAPSPEGVAQDLLGYGGAIFWEADGQAVALATVTRPVEHAARIVVVYTPHSARHRGFASAVTVAASRAALARDEVREVLLISDRTSPLRRASSLGYEMASERVQVKFGPPTGPMPRMTGPMPRMTGSMPRLTGPMPRLTGPLTRLRGRVGHG
jgi:hypothetical protein